MREFFVHACYRNRVIKMPTWGKESLPISIVVGDERVWECGSVAF